MKIVLLEADSVGTDISFDRFNELGEVVRYSNTKIEDVPERIKDADVIVLNKLPMKEATLKGAQNLKLICLTATGTNVVDFEYTNQRGIVVTNVKGYSTDSVVQHTFAMFFYLYEKLHAYDEYVKSGEYIRCNSFSMFEHKFRELAGKTWGIIGLGDIGKGVAKVARAFGCNVIYYSTSGHNSNSEYTQVDLDQLLASSDIISIHAPLNQTTRDLIGEEEFNKMKKECVLLNLGRGPIVNEQALYQALSEEKIAAAGLDVLSREPMLATNPLIKIQDSTKLLITPHIAWGTVEARTRVVKEVYENIIAYKQGIKRNVVVE